MDTDMKHDKRWETWIQQIITDLGCVC